MSVGSLPECSRPSESENRRFRVSIVLKGERPNKGTSCPVNLGASQPIRSVGCGQERSVYGGPVWNQRRTRRKLFRCAPHIHSRPSTDSNAKPKRFAQCRSIGRSRSKEQCDAATWWTYLSGA